MNFDIYKNQIEELILLHKYIKKKIFIRVVILLIIAVIDIIFTIIFSENNDMIFEVIVAALVSWSVVILLIVNICKLTASFQNGNYSELVKNILSNETNASIELITDKKMSKEILVNNSNFITKSYTPYFNTFMKIGDLYYQYLSVTFSKNVIYEGYVIITDIEIDGDFKIVDNELSMYMISNYKKDKEFSSKKPFIYYKKNKDDTVVEYIDKVIDYVNELFGVEVPVGICIYNNHLTILLGSCFKNKRKKFSFSFKLNEQTIKDYIEQILTDLKNTKLVKEKILESANSYESI